MGELFGRRRQPSPWQRLPRRGVPDPGGSGRVYPSSDRFEFLKGEPCVASFILFAAARGFSACVSVPKGHTKVAAGESPSSRRCPPPAPRPLQVRDRPPNTFIATAGYDCPDRRRTDRVELALQSGSRAGAYVLSIYTGPETVQTAFQQLKSISPDGVYLAVRENWIIDTKQVEAVAATLGGVHVTG